MDRSEKPANRPTLDELERLGAERRPIAAWLEKLEGLRSEVSSGVFDRVRSDYEGRLKGIDRRATPLLAEARKSVSEIDGELERLESERRGLDLDLQELALRHSLAELTDDELAEREGAPRARIAAIAAELERSRGDRERWRAAIEQGFAAAGAELPPSRSPRVDLSPATVEPKLSAPAKPAPTPQEAGAVAEPRRVDITMPQPIPPPRASSPAVPLPGAAVVEASRTAHVAPMTPAPPPPGEAAGRTALYSPAPPPPPLPIPPAADAGGRTALYTPPAPPPPAPDVAGRTSVFVPSPPPPPPPPSSGAAEAAGRTALFSPAPAPDRTVVFGSVPPPAAGPAAKAASVPKARLIAVESTGATPKEHLLAAESTIGRVPENAIPVPHGSVSRHHATLRYADGAWWIVDQKSENGTWVNGERITERKLGDDDRINIGTVRFRFKLD